MGESDLEPADTDIFIRIHQKLKQIDSLASEHVPGFSIYSENNKLREDVRGEILKMGEIIYALLSRLENLNSSSTQSERLDYLPSARLSTSELESHADLGYIPTGEMTGMPATKRKLVMEPDTGIVTEKEVREEDGNIIVADDRLLQAVKEIDDHKNQNIISADDKEENGDDLKNLFNI